MGTFYQEAPELKNQYQTDALLRSYVKRTLPKEVIEEMEPEFLDLGQRVTDVIYEMGLEAEQHEPHLVQYDAWGRRVDKIMVSHGWRQLDAVAAEEGLVALAYERSFQEYSRLAQFVKLYLYTPSSAIYTCPLSMTDGAARLIELFGDENLKSRAFRHLTSRDPRHFWTAGQWMTERPGGSDVSQSETVARFTTEGWKLYGDKWFTSATTSQMAMTLARIENEQGESVPGNKGLSLFYLETRDANGHLNGIRINRLKNKLGTRALPTAELTLDGTVAKLVGEVGRGIRNISVLFNITRIYNAVSAVSYMRRGLALALDYAEKRRAFGRPLSQQPLHLETLANQELELTTGFLLTFHLAHLQGKLESEKASQEEQQLLRILTPLAKLFTAKQVVRVSSEIVESFGGAGYVEDTQLPKIVRDVHALAIWEGTTNVLSLDVLRSMNKEDTLPPLLKDMHQRLAGIQNDKLQSSLALVKQGLQQIQQYAEQNAGQHADFHQAGAREFSYSLTRLYCAILLMEHAQWSAAKEGDTRYLVMAQRWCRQPLLSLIHPDENYRLETELLVLHKYPN